MQKKKESKNIQDNSHCTKKFMKKKQIYSTTPKDINYNKPTNPNKAPPMLTYML